MIFLLPFLLLLGLSSATNPNPSWDFEIREVVDTKDLTRFFQILRGNKVDSKLYSFYATYLAIHWDSTRANNHSSFWNTINFVLSEDTFDSFTNFLKGATSEIFSCDQEQALRALSQGMFPGSQQHLELDRVPHVESYDKAVLLLNKLIAEYLHARLRPRLSKGFNFPTTDEIMKLEYRKLAFIFSHRIAQSELIQAMADFLLLWFEPFKQADIDTTKSIVGIVSRLFMNEVCNKFECLDLEFLPKHILSQSIARVYLNEGIEPSLVNDENIAKIKSCSLNLIDQGNLPLNPAVYLGEETSLMDFTGWIAGKKSAFGLLIENPEISISKVTYLISLLGENIPYREFLCLVNKAMKLRGFPRETLVGGLVSLTINSLITNRRFYQKELCYMSGILSSLDKGSLSASSVISMVDSILQWIHDGKTFPPDSLSAFAQLTHAIVANQILLSFEEAAKVLQDNLGISLDPNHTESEMVKSLEKWGQLYEHYLTRTH